MLPSISVAAAALFYTDAVAIAAEHEHAMKVWKTGEVTFAKETKVGKRLKPGRFKFDHRTPQSAASRRRRPSRIYSRGSFTAWMWPAGSGHVCNLVQ